VSPFCGQQLPASKGRDGARKLHGSRNNAYGCLGSEGQRMSAFASTCCPSIVSQFEIQSRFPDFAASIMASST
jgi:hypothetical protein